MMSVRHAEPLRNRSTAELVRDLSRQLSTLARQEVELAKTEMAEKGKRAGAGAGMLAASAVFGLVTLGTLSAFLVLVLAEAMPAWAAAFLVTALWAVVAVALAVLGRDKLEEAGKPMPEKTVESVKEDIQWLKGQTRSETR
jgi:MFS family permease